MTGAELAQRLKADGWRVTYADEVDSHTAARALNVSMSTLHRMLRDGTAPTHRKYNRKLWFTVEGLADALNARAEMS